MMADDEGTPRQYASSPCMAGEIAPDYYDRDATTGEMTMTLKHAEPGTVVDLRPFVSAIRAAKAHAK